MKEAIRLIKLYFDINDIVDMEDIEGAYYELTWRDLLEDNPHFTDTLILTMFNEIKVKIKIEPIRDKLKIVSIG